MKGRTARVVTERMVASVLSMTIQPPILRFAVLAWLCLEIALALRNRIARQRSTTRDSGSKALLIAAIGIGFWLSFRFRSITATRIDDGQAWPTLLAVVLFILGFTIRLQAVFTLGRFFTTTVTVDPSHQLVRRGLYAHIRHPGYLGSLLIFAGIGFTFHNWLSLLALFILAFSGFLNRIHVEERVLVTTFGAEYSEYARKTKRLVPGVY